MNPENCSGRSGPAQDPPIIPPEAKSMLKQGSLLYARPAIATSIRVSHKLKSDTLSIDPDVFLGKPARENGEQSRQPAHLTGERLAFGKVMPAV